MANKSTSKVYQLIIELKNIKPRIWRRIQVLDDITLDELHEVIQTVMGWSNTHLYGFDVKGIMFTRIDEYKDMDGEDAEKITLDKVLKKEKEKITYSYDFGDDWIHEVKLEKISEPMPGVPYPLCTDGKRACPPEDCGGPWGYEELLKILADSENPEYEERKEWVGPYFDPEEFDLEQVNKDIDQDWEFEESDNVGYNTEKVDEMMLALLFLNMFEDKKNIKAYKLININMLERLHQKGYISNPDTEDIIMNVTEDGLQKAQELFEKYFKK